MKNSLYTIIIFTLILSSCLKDKGTYELREINRVNIIGLDTLYYADYGDSIRIKPTLSFTMDDAADTANYTYLWMIDHEIGRSSASIELGTSHDLNRMASIPYGLYACYYRVTDKRTGVFTDHYFNLRVGGIAYEGWMFLIDPGDGTSRLDMTSNRGLTDTLYRDILGLSKSTFPTDAKPSFIATGIAILTPPHNGGMALFMGTHNLAASLGLDTLEYVPGSYDLNNAMRTSPVKDFTGAKMLIGRYCGLLYAEHNVRVLQGNWSISAPINSVNGSSTLFKVSPHLGFVVGPITNNFAVLFNEDTKSFVRYIGSGTTCYDMPAGNLFSFSNTNKDLVYMKWVKYNGGEIFAIMRDEDDAFHLARFDIRGNSQRSYQTMNATDIDKATSFAVSNELGYVFYSVGGKVYEYDFLQDRSILMQDYGNRLVSVLKFQEFSNNLPGQANEAKYLDLAQKLVVATYDPADQLTSGQVDLFTVPDINRPFELFTSYTGTGKVVDIAYRDR